MNTKYGLTATLVAALGAVGMLTAPSADACVYNLTAGFTANAPISGSPTIAGGAAASGDVCGSSITLTGYNATSTTTPNPTTALYNKADGGDQIGIGLAGKSDNEVVVGTFIQIDLAGVKDANGNSILGTNTPLSIGSGSTTAGEAWNLFGSNTAGVFGNGSALATSNTENVINFNSSGFRYLDFTAAAGIDNVLLAHFDSPEQGMPMPGVPEPASLALLGTALVGLGFVRRRRRPTASV